MKVFAISCLLAVAGAAPAPEAEADAQFLAAAPYHATNCKNVPEVLITQHCVPTTENVCTTSIVETEEIEFEKVCKEVTHNICDAPAVGYHAIGKREAEAEADPQYFAAPYAAVAPVAAVAHSVQATVKHACRAVTTEHCVDNPKIKPVPVEVENCNVVTKVACSDVENTIAVTQCVPVETTHLSYGGYAGYGYGYGK